VSAHDEFEERYLLTEISRRELLRRIALTGGAAATAPSLAALLAACGPEQAKQPVRTGGTVTFAIGNEPKYPTRPSTHSRSSRSSTR